MLEIKKGTKQGDLLLSLFFRTGSTESTGTRHSSAGKRKKVLRIYLSDNDHDCLTNMRFADDVLSVCNHSKNSFKKCCANSTRVLTK